MKYVLAAGYGFILMVVVLILGSIEIGLPTVKDITWGFIMFYWLCFLTGLKAVNSQIKV